MRYPFLDPYFSSRRLSCESPHPPPSGRGIEIVISTSGPDGGTTSGTRSETSPRGQDGAPRTLSDSREKRQGAETTKTEYHWSWEWPGKEIGGRDDGSPAGGAPGAGEDAGVGGKGKHYEWSWSWPRVDDRGGGAESRDHGRDTGDQGRERRYGGQRRADRYREEGIPGSSDATQMDPALVALSHALQLEQVRREGYRQGYLESTLSSLLSPPSDQVAPQTDQAIVPLSRQSYARTHPLSTIAGVGFVSGLTLAATFYAGCRTMRYLARPPMRGAYAGERGPWGRRIDDLERRVVDNVQSGNRDRRVELEGLRRELLGYMGVDGRGGRIGGGGRNDKIGGAVAAGPPGLIGQSQPDVDDGRPKTDSKSVERDIREKAEDVKVAPGAEKEMDFEGVKKAIEELKRVSPATAITAEKASEPRGVETTEQAGDHMSVDAPLYPAGTSASVLAAALGTSAYTIKAGSMGAEDIDARMAENAGKGPADVVSRQPDLQVASEGPVQSEISPEKVNAATEPKGDIPSSVKPVATSKPEARAGLRVFLSAGLPSWGNDGPWFSGGDTQERISRFHSAGWEDIIQPFNRRYCLVIDMPSVPDQPLRVTVLEDSVTVNVIYFDTSLKEVDKASKGWQDHVGSSYAARCSVSWNEKKDKWVGSLIDLQTAIPSSKPIRLESPSEDLPRANNHGHMSQWPSWKVWRLEFDQIMGEALGRIGIHPEWAESSKPDRTGERGGPRAGSRAKEPITESTISALSESTKLPSTDPSLLEMAGSTARSRLEVERAEAFDEWKRTGRNTSASRGPLESNAHMRRMLRSGSSSCRQTAASDCPPPTATPVASPRMVKPAATSTTPLLPPTNPHSPPKTISKTLQGKVSPDAPLDQPKSSPGIGASTEDVRTFTIYVFPIGPKDGTGWKDRTIQLNQFVSARQERKEGGITSSSHSATSTFRVIPAKILYSPAVTMVEIEGERWRCEWDRGRYVIKERVPESGK